MKFFLYFVYAGMSYFLSGHADYTVTCNHVKVWCKLPQQTDYYEWAILETNGDTLRLDDGSWALRTRNAIEIHDTDFHLSVTND